MNTYAEMGGGWLVGFSDPSLVLSSEKRLPRKVYPPRRNVYQRDELSPHQRVELFEVKSHHGVFSA
jgi:hypothetical protein